MTSRIKANEIDALTAGAALSVNATPTFTKAGTFSDTLAVTNNLTVSKNLVASANASLTGMLTVGNGIVVSDANITFAAGHGIDFSSASGSASGSASALLDDYEEGTWTAELRGADARASTPVEQTSAKYIKIGTQVFVQCYFANVNTTGASGIMQIVGFPFTSVNQLFPLSIMTYGMDYDDATAIMSIHMYIENGTTGNLIATKDNAAWQSTGITAASGKYVAMCGTYLTS